MTRKHFKILAEEIRHISDEVQRLSAAKAIAVACKRISPNFDTQRFYEACGVSV
jgi:hypothetical protein